MKTLPPLSLGHFHHHMIPTYPRLLRHRQSLGKHYPLMTSSVASMKRLTDVPSRTSPRRTIATLPSPREKGRAVTRRVQQSPTLNATTATRRGMLRPTVGRRVEARRGPGQGRKEKGRPRRPQTPPQTKMMMVCGWRKSRLTCSCSKKNGDHLSKATAIPRIAVQALQGVGYLIMTMKTFSRLKKMAASMWA